MKDPPLFQAPAAGPVALGRLRGLSSRPLCVALPMGITREGRREAGWGEGRAEGRPLPGV